MTLDWLDQILDEQGLDSAISAVLAMQDAANKLTALRKVCDALRDVDRLLETIPLLEMAARIQAKQAWVEHFRSQIAIKHGDVPGHFRHLGLAFALDPVDRAVAISYVHALLQRGMHPDATVALREHIDHVCFAHSSLPIWEEPVRKSLNELNDTERTTRMYLDLLERTVSNWIYEDSRNQFGEILPFNAQFRAVGRDIPSQAHSMIGLRRLRHLRVLAEQVLSENIPGDFVEAGVWRGGACILMAGALSAYGALDRRVVVADSFEGLPAPDARYPKDDLSVFDFHLRDELAVGLDSVRSNFDRYDLLGEHVFFLKGVFRDTLPSYPLGPIAILRLDCDLYSSTMDTLIHLYSRVTPGGWVICDDYGVVIDARRAVLDFRASQGISSPMTAVDGDAVFWRKE